MASPLIDLNAQAAALSCTSGILAASSVIAGKIATGGVSAAGQFAAAPAKTMAGSRIPPPSGRMPER